MPGDPRIRASDADRERAAALLSEHHAAGRLTAGEFHDRMERAMDATTLAEIDELMTDLPAIDLYQLPDAALRRAHPGLGRSLLPGAPLSRDPSRRHVVLPHETITGDVDDALSAGVAAVVAWAAVATTLIAIGLVTAVLIGAVSWIAFAALPAAAIAWIWFLIRRRS
jgi:Domain of unknown function (DUF1707)